jgi:AraC-like DNA-binding protein
LGLEIVYSTLERGYSFHHLLAARVALEHSLSSLVELTRTSGSEKSADERTANVRQLIIASPGRDYRLHELANAAGLSVPHFTSLFKRQCGYAPIDFVIRQRIRLSCRLLDTTTATIGSIAEQVGFKDPYYFSRCFNRIMGSSPRDYRRIVKG